MTHRNKVKGNTYERELVNQAKDIGLEAKRAWASDGRSLGLHEEVDLVIDGKNCLLYTSPSPRDGLLSRMPSSA